MGSGDWLKTIISRKKKGGRGKSNQSKGSSASEKQTETCNGSQSRHKYQKNNPNGALSIPSEVAATRIQTAFRAYMARKALRRMKGAIRFQKLTQAKCVRKQAASTLTHLHSWSGIQSQIRDRRLCMLTEGRIKQKKQENQMKLEAKLHDLEVEWDGGADSMEVILSRIYQREAAAVKRERTLAYAFSHQWKANSCHNQTHNASELGKANWGWSWKERWNAARPWENRFPSQTVSPKKIQKKPTSNAGKNKNAQTTKKTVPVKPELLNGKAPGKGRRLSYSGAEKPAEKGLNSKVQETTVKKQELVS